MAMFDGWSERERVGFVLFAGWKKYWTDTRGWCPEFRNLTPEEIRQQPNFEKFCEAAEWLTKHGRPVGHTLHGWRRYLAYRCDELQAINQRPSPRHLISEYHLGRFNAGCSQTEERVEQRSRQQLFVLYRKALHPSIRSTDCMRVLGLDLLAVQTE